MLILNKIYFMSNPIKDLLSKISPEQIEALQRKIQSTVLHAEKMGFSIKFTIDKTIKSFTLDNSQLRLGLSEDKASEIRDAFFSAINNMLQALKQNETEAAKKLLGSKESIDNATVESIRKVQDENGNIIISIHENGIHIDISIEKVIQKISINHKILNISEEQAEALEEILRSLILIITEEIRKEELESAKRLFSF